jgi:hypothetical protein
MADGSCGCCSSGRVKSPDHSSGEVEHRYLALIVPSVSGSTLVTTIG